MRGSECGAGARCSSPARPILYEQFTGAAGRYVKIADTVKGFRGIVEGKYDDIPEQAFYMKGTIDEVIEAAEKMKTAA